MYGCPQIAQRIASAHNTLVETLAELARISTEDAKRAADYYIRERLVTLDAVGGVYRLKHGAFAEADVIRRAAVPTTTHRSIK